jgi:PAS domain S-box-containing protein
MFQNEFNVLSLASFSKSLGPNLNNQSYVHESPKRSGQKIEFWTLEPSYLKKKLKQIGSQKVNSAELREFHSDPSTSRLLSKLWEGYSRLNHVANDPKSILNYGNLVLADGGSNLIFVLPIISSEGKAVGMAISTLPVSRVQSLLPSETFLVDSQSSSFISKEGINLSESGQDQSVYHRGISNGGYSTVTRIPISLTANSWRLRSEHQASELWFRPEIKRILDFHASLIAITWLFVYFLVKSADRGRNRQRAIIGSLVQKVIWITNEHGNIDFALGKITEHLGWKEIDYLDVDVTLFVHPDDRERMTKSISNAQTNPAKDEIFEVRFENKDREFRWYEVTVTNMIDVPEIGGIVVTAHDIEQRMHATDHIIASKRAAEKANEAKSDFLSRMSHELRTPLNAILGFGQLLEMEAISDRQAENVEQILIAGRHLLDLVNDILDIARIETRKVNLSVEQVNIAEIIEESMALLAPLSSKSQVPLVFERAECPDVWSDRQRLKQIFLNLLSNGIKYNRPGGSVVVSICGTEDTLQIQFADTGIGIESHFLDRVFTPFDRLGSDIASVEGSGLGLALSKTLAEAMGAGLTVSSTYGKGSIFSFIFGASAFVQRDLDNQNHETDLFFHNGFDDGSSLRVLLIEDNIINLRYVSKVIQKMNGVSLMSAKEGGVGIELAKTFLPDLILLDLDLPDISGEDVLRSIIEDPATSNIHVVVMSGESNPHVVEKFLSLGAQDFVSKPVDVNSLIQLFNAEKKAA